MIKASDIRLNNWIDFKGENIQAMGIDFDDYRSEPAEYIINNRNIIAYNGIPLTHDWLLKFGFDKSKHGWYEKMPVARFTIESNGDAFMINSGYDADGEPNMIAIIYFVHELQNFWSACNLGDL